MDNKLFVPGAIVIAGLIIAGAVFYSGSDGTTPTDDNPDVGEVSMRDVSEDDHILGNPNAALVIVEYSDFECPFCKRFHETMNQIMDEYGPGGQVAWVYRHFPLDQLHPVKARLEAVTSECVSDLGGNEAFWAFANRFYELTPSNNQTNVDVLLPQIIAEIGLDQSAVDECVKSGKYDDRVQADAADAQSAGGTGTPYSVIVARSGQRVPINGAQPYETVKQVIDALLGEQ